MTGNWQDVLSDASTQERYTTMFRARNEVLGAFIESALDGSAAGSAVPGGRSREAEEAQADELQGSRAHESPLDGLPVAVKDNIAVEGFHLTCGSTLLRDYNCPYDATAVRLLREAGAFIPGKTALDEFGMGSATDTSSFVDCRNPWDPSRTAGGSSGGSAAAVAAGMVPAALGSDTGGSIRQPAGFCGVYGLKPTYGAVSRYGLVAYASSLDTVGVLADTPQRVADVFRAISAPDERDQTSAAGPDSPGAGGGAGPHANEVGGEPSHAPDAGEAPGGAESRALHADDAAGAGETVRVLESMKGLRIGVLEGDLGLSDGVEAVYRATVERLRDAGAEIVTIDLKSLEYAAAVYYTIAAAEAGANLARFDGVRYGARPDYAENPEEMTRLARSEGLGDEVKLRILLGTFVLRSGFHDQYYGRAQRLRNSIAAELGRAFERCSAILAPTFPTVAFPLGSAGPDGLARKQADRFTSLANLAGLPALAFPAGLASAGEDAGGGEAAGVDAAGGAANAPRGDAANPRPDAAGEDAAGGAASQPRGGRSDSTSDAAGTDAAEPGKLPVGLQLLGPAWSEERLLSIVATLHAGQEPAIPPEYPREWS